MKMICTHAIQCGVEGTGCTHKTAHEKTYYCTKKIWCDIIDKEVCCVEKEEEK